MIKIGFVNFWNVPEERIKLVQSTFLEPFDTLNVEYEVADPCLEKCDIVFSSIFKNKKIIGNPIAVLYSGESRISYPDYLNNIKYVISFNPSDDNNLYFPVYMLNSNISSTNDCVNNDGKYKEEYFNRGFCSCLISNMFYKKQYRKILVSLVNFLQKVSFGGIYRNNVGGRVEDKMKFISKYKFNFCAENESQDYYVTEKIFDAIAARTIPIYWGETKIIDELFNEDAYINFNKRSILSTLIKIFKINKDPILYKRMLSTKCIKDPNMFEKYRQDLVDFIKKILIENFGNEVFNLK